MSFVEFNNVTFGYKEDDYLLLEDLSFSTEKNDIIIVIGASGCGKSTLFRLMTCLETEYKGSITINGKTPKEATGTAAFMPQKDLLMPWRNILKNVTLPLEALPMSKAERISQAKEAIEKWGCRVVRINVRQNFRAVCVREYRLQERLYSCGTAGNLCCLTSRSRRWIRLQGSLCRTGLSGR